MASDAKFKTIPPFPEDLNITKMQTVSLSGLISGDEEAAKSLFSSSQDLGFFQLDLRGTEIGEAMIQEIDQLLDFSKAVFEIPQETRVKYRVYPPQNFFGFKISGVTFTETGQLDRYEMLNLSQDALLGNKEPQPLPEPVLEKNDLLISYAQHCHFLTMAILRSLSTQLSLPDDAFTSLHDLKKPSGTTIRLLKSLACPEKEDQRTSLIHHTDSGSITLLANLVGGLQVLSPGGDPHSESDWGWVRPLPGHLIVNLGDVMPELTGGILCSNVHRVRCQPAGQEHLDRYSTAVLVRPELGASMKRKVGEPSSEDFEMTIGQYEMFKLKQILEGKWAIKTRGGKLALPELLAK